MEQFRPDWYAAQRSYAHACLGDREETLAWAEKALEETDPSRNFRNYFDSMQMLAVSFALIGETDRACQLIDQILASPSGITCGGILFDYSFESLHGEPAFEAVIRKHADQLKDPAILEQIFGS
jgi:hypothetical protein